jgi:hypothetical protein
MPSSSATDGASSELAPPESRKLFFVSTEVASYFVGEWRILILAKEGGLLI